MIGLWVNNRNVFVILKVGHASWEDFVGAVVIENNASNVLRHSGNGFSYKIKVVVSNSHLGVIVAVEVVIGGACKGGCRGADDHVGEGDELRFVVFSVGQ